MIQGPLKGYGSLTTGPVASEPVTSWLSPQQKNNAFPYNPTKAKSLLTSHGWNVVPGGTTALHECQPVRFGDQRGYRAELHLRLCDRAGVDSGGS